MKARNEEPRHACGFLRSRRLRSGFSRDTFSPWHTGTRTRVRLSGWFRSAWAIQPRRSSLSSSALRTAYIDVCNTMAGRVFGQEPLVSCPTAQEIHDTLYGWQCNDRPPDLNVVYVEKARLSVGPAVSRCHQEYFVRLVRWLKGCGKEKRYSRWKRERAEKRGETLRRWESVPVEMQDEVTAGDLEQLRTHASALTFPQALDLFRAVAMEGLDAGLSPVQAKVVRAIHQSAQERHRCPAYGTDKRFTAQFHLDYRIVKGRADALNGTLADLETHARILVDEGNGCYKTFLEISNPVPYGAAIRLPMVLHAATLKRLLEKEDRPSGNGDADRPSANSIAIELGASRIQVKLCLARPDPLPDAVREAEDGTSGQEKEPDWDELARRLNACDYFLGRDYGYANTVALCLIRRDREVSADDLRRIAAFDKEGALEYLTTHSHDGPEVVERFLFDGRDFMARIHLWSLKIDLLRAEVDLVYDRIRRIKALLVPVLGLRPDELIPVSAMAADHADPRTARLVKRFFHLLDAVKSLKARSLAAYAAIDGIKKSWFGLASSWSGRVALLGLDRPQRHADEFGVGADARLPVDGSRPAGAEGIHAEAGRRAGTDFLSDLAPAQPPATRRRPPGLAAHPAHWRCHTTGWRRSPPANHPSHTMVFLTSGPLAMPDVAAPGRGGAAMPIRTQAAVTAWKGRGSRWPILSAAAPYS